MDEVPFSSGDPTDYSLTSPATKCIKTDSDGQPPYETTGEPLDTVAIVNQVRTTLKALNLPQRHLLSVVECAEGTLCITLQKAGVPWHLLHPANRKAFQALNDWVKANACALTAESLPLTPEEDVDEEIKSVFPTAEKKVRRPRKRKLRSTSKNIHSSRMTRLADKSNLPSNVSTTTIAGFVEKRRRGRPPLHGKNSRVRRTQVTRKSPITIAGGRMSVKDFIKSVAGDSHAEELNALEFDVKALTELVKQALHQRKMTQDTLANELGVVLPTLNRIINDSSWLPWSATNDFRKAVFHKMNAWLKNVESENSGNLSSDSTKVSDSTASLRSESMPVSELSNPSSSTCPSDNIPIKLSTDGVLDLSVRHDFSINYSRPTSSASVKMLELISPSTSSCDSVSCFEIADEIPSATCPPYSTCDIREGQRLWPCHASLDQPYPGEILVDEMINICNRKCEVLRNSRLTVVHGSRYGIVGPCCSGKTSVLRLLAKRKAIDIPKNCTVLYCDQQVASHDFPANYSFTRVVEYVRQSGNGGLNCDSKLVLPSLFSTPINLRDAWCGGSEIKARLILDGLGFSRDAQNALIRDVHPRMKPRLSLARALFAEPTLLLLDEPTTFLDFDAVLFLQSYLQKYKNTLMLVSNCPGLLDNVCTDIIRVENQSLLYLSRSYRSFPRSFGNSSI